MRRTARNTGDKFVARCGHLVPAGYDYVETSDGDPLEPTVLRWCNPVCADQADPEPGALGPAVCTWFGCAEEGTPRHIEVTGPAPNMGGGVTVLVAFSGAPILCDEHEAAATAMIEETLREGGA